MSWGLFSRTPPEGSKSAYKSTTQPKIENNAYPPVNKPQNSSLQSLNQRLNALQNDFMNLQNEFHARIINIQSQIFEINFLINSTQLPLTSPDRTHNSQSNYHNPYSNAHYKDNNNLNYYSNNNFNYPIQSAINNSNSSSIDKKNSNTGYSQNNQRVITSTGEPNSRVPAPPPEVIKPEPVIPKPRVLLNIVNSLSISVIPKFKEIFASQTDITFDNIIGNKLPTITLYCVRVDTRIVESDLKKDIESLSRNHKILLLFRNLIDNEITLSNNFSGVYLGTASPKYAYFQFYYEEFMASFSLIGHNNESEFSRLLSFILSNFAPEQ